VTDRLDQLVRDARTLAYAVLGSAAEALEAGAPVGRIQGHFVTRAAILLADVEASAVLAAAVLLSIEQHVIDLAELRTQLAAEFGDG
jgi:hypothetical protein